MLDNSKFSELKISQTFTETPINNVYYTNSRRIVNKHTRAPQPWGSFVYIPARNCSTHYSMKVSLIFPKSNNSTNYDCQRVLVNDNIYIDMQTGINLEVLR